VNKEFQAAIEKFTADNLYILHYRDDLYARFAGGAGIAQGGDRRHVCTGEAWRELIGDVHAGGQLDSELVSSGRSATARWHQPGAGGSLLQTVKDAQLSAVYGAWRGETTRWACTGKAGRTDLERRHSGR